MMVAREAPLTGTVEIDEFYLGGRLKRSPDAPPPGRGRKGQRRTTKAPVLAMVQRPETTTIGSSAGHARASVVEDLSFAQTEQVLEIDVDPQAAGFDVVISGHSHKPAVTERNGVQFVNPGSAGPRRFSLPVTIAYLDIATVGIHARITEIL